MATEPGLRKEGIISRTEQCSSHFGGDIVRICRTPVHGLAVLDVLCESFVVRLDGKVTYPLSHSKDLLTLGSMFIRDNSGDINLTPTIKEDAVNEVHLVIHLSGLEQMNTVDHG